MWCNYDVLMTPSLTSTTVDLRLVIVLCRQLASRLLQDLPNSDDGTLLHVLDTGKVV